MPCLPRVYVCMYVCMSVYVCMYVCMCVYVFFPRVAYQGHLAGRGLGLLPHLYPLSVVHGHVGGEVAAVLLEEIDAHFHIFF